MSDGTNGTLDLSTTTLGIHRGGAALVVEQAEGPPTRIDGYTFGAPFLTREPPHAGEMHPDGDEVLLLVSGRLTVVLEDADPPRRVELTPGRAVVVPRGVWHRVELGEPSQLVHLTPGPRGEHRPLPAGDV